MMKEMLRFFSGWQNHIPVILMLGGDTVARTYLLFNNRKSVYIQNIM